MNRTGLPAVVFSVALLAVVAPACGRAAEQQARAATPPTRSDSAPSVASLIESLSEEGGYFDTDNLISNERSYGAAVARLHEVGGVYIGVGPEQNFSYIARTRPRWAFLVDVRRDNLLQHLLLGAVLEQAETPLEYLCLLFSKSCIKTDLAAGSTLSPPAIVARLEGSETSTALREENHQRFLDHISEDLGIALSPRDREYIGSVLRTFYDEQLDLRFRSHGRPSRWDYPSYRDLLRERTPDGAWASFLGDREGYAHVRKLARTGHLVPIVGDLAGPSALGAVARFLEQEGEQVTTLYVSNVEFYLLRSPGAFTAYLDNLRGLPLADDSVVIRSYFDYGMAHPLARPGERSTLVLQRAKRFLELQSERPYRDYWDVCTRDYME